MKSLAFDNSAEGKDRFQIVYQGFLLGAPEGGVKGIEANRRALKIMDKLEAISEPVYGGENSEQLVYQSGDLIRQLKADGEYGLVLEDAEVSMLKAHLNNVPWRPALAKIVVAVFDQIEAK